MGMMFHSFETYRTTCSDTDSCLSNLAPSLTIGLRGGLLALGVFMLAVYLRIIEFVECAHGVGVSLHIEDLDTQRKAAFHFVFLRPSQQVPSQFRSLRAKVHFAKISPDIWELVYSGTFFQLRGVGWTCRFVRLVSVPRQAPNARTRPNAWYSHLICDLCVRHPIGRLLRIWTDVLSISFCDLPINDYGAMKTNASLLSRKIRQDHRFSRSLTV
ncbi:hypothetical protein LshimejAT787_0101890 [Lyophyllum shimeji]|uniref:Uncharacterized protein n=1 Tax=Lyophyllum shimeji TaxID=47721 RepID=A0A9P3PC90_LYOSH|nr:hypothetical protein LshimejAT787_0101890 [Lyophyllum shimeji]